MANRDQRRRNLAKMSRAERKRFLAAKAEKLTGGVWVTPRERMMLHAAAKRSVPGPFAPDDYEFRAGDHVLDDGVTVKVLR